MGSTVTARIPDETRRELEKIVEKEHLDRSAIVRRLLERAIRDYKLEEALERYRERKISLGKAAEHAGVSLREILSEMGKKGIQFDYSTESLEEDIRASNE